MFNLRQVLHSLVVGVMLLSIPMSANALPDVFVQEGLLMDAEGRVFHGRYDLRIQLYDAEDADGSVYDETHRQVEVIEGYYAVVIGTVAKSVDCK